MGIAATNVSTTANATAAMTAITKAINNISNSIAQLGSAQISLQGASNLDMNTVENLAAESNSLSPNIASASTQTATNTILEQADVLVLAKSNTTSEYAVQLLPNNQNDSSTNGSIINLQL